MLTSLVLGISWLSAAVMSGLAVWRLMLAARAARFEALVAAVATALLWPALASAWVLLLPWRFSASSALGGLLVVVAAIIILRSPKAQPAQRPRPGVADAAVALPATLLIGGAGLISLYAAWIKPVWEIDALLYHGPSVANLIQHGSLFNWDSPSQWIFYPNLAAVMSAAVAVTARSLAWLDATQAPFLVLLGLVTWAWAGRGHPRGLVGVVAAIAVLTPAAFVQGRAMYIDIIYAATLLAGLWLIGLWLSRNQRVFLVLGMAAVGAAPALKPSGITIAMAIAALVIVITLVWRRREGGTTLAWGLVAAVMASAPFYLRNAVEFRNPLYPVSFEVPGHRFPGPADAALFFDSAAPPELVALPGPIGFFRNLGYSITSMPTPLIYDTRVGAFGPITSILGILLGAGILAVVLAGRGGVGRRLKPFVWPTAALVLVIVLQLQSWNPRYTLTAYALLVVMAGLGLASIRMPRAMEAMMSIGLLMVLVGTTAMAEERTMQSISASLAAQDTDPRFNKGVTGTNPAYQDQYAWLAGAPCGTRVVVASLGTQVGLLNAYNLPMWGDGLCNDVVVVRDIRGGGGDYLQGDRRNLERAIPGADYVVAFEADRDLVRGVARRNGLAATVISNPPDYFGADQVVFKMSPKHPPSRSGGTPRTP